MRWRGLLLIALILVASAAYALAEQTIPADTYLDRLQGMWLGEILGNYAGRPQEGATARGGLTYTVPWSTLITTTPWGGDDDTAFEYLASSVLMDHTTPTAADVKDAWVSSVPSGSFYIANKQARLLMNNPPALAPPDTGSIHYNMHWYAIDSQITTEALGAAAPGMRQKAADLANTFGSVTNNGYALHAAQFYAAMYAAAPLETNVETVVAKGLEVVPTTSRTHKVIQDVRDWYNADKADGTLDWRDTQTKIYDAYCANPGAKGQYRYWIESTINTGLTTMALLYGQGDFEQTVEIAVQGGFDADCNPATAGGLIGLMKGFSGLPADLTSDASGQYKVLTLKNITTDTTISQVAQNWQTVAEQQILAAGGTITGSGASAVYHLPDDMLSPLVEKPDPAGPKGLVGQVRALGGTVTTSASYECHSTVYDRTNLDQIIDGITDQSYNGQLPYTTNDGITAQPAGGDWYQLNFDSDVLFKSLIFYEGDITWDGINSDPRTTMPRGGYFLNLTAEVGQDGVFTPVSDLTLSEPLDPYTFYQQITLMFDPIVGDAIRIRGDAGGSLQFTSIVELEAYGQVPEPTTLGLLSLGAVALFNRKKVRGGGGAPRARPAPAATASRVQGVASIDDQLPVT